MNTTSHTFVYNMIHYGAPLQGFPCLYIGRTSLQIVPSRLCPCSLSQLTRLVLGRLEPIGRLPAKGGGGAGGGGGGGAPGGGGGGGMDIVGVVGTDLVIGVDRRGVVLLLDPAPLFLADDLLSLFGIGGSGLVAMESFLFFDLFLRVFFSVLVSSIAPPTCLTRPF